MKEEKDDIVGIIPENEYQPDLEKEVAYYLAISVKPTFVSKKRYTPNNFPTSFANPREEADFKAEEIRRMVNGYDGLSGKGYGWLHYGRLKALKGGKIRPQFRAKQEEFFQKLTELYANPGRGIVGYKRRRFGFSYLAAWDVLHECSTKKLRQVGMNSKGEVDSRRLFGFVKFMHQNLPDFMRVRATVSDRRDFMEFSHWYDPVKRKIVSTKGLNGIKRGTESTILSVAPTDSGHEGNAYTTLLIDEAGKIPNLLTIWGFAEDCLLDNTERVGVPVILGTVGDIDKDGKGLRDMWLHNETYALDRFPVHGYNGLIIDEFGNDMIEDAIRWIVYERRKRRAGARKTYEAFIQKYPLCEKDAFNQVTEGGVGNIILINDQITKLSYNPAEQRVGWMRRKPEGGVDFVPNPEGKIIVYDLPDASRVNGYVAGADPVDHDDIRKTRDTSNIALAIIAKPYGVQPPRLALEYVDRPEKVDSFFEQSAMALQWYNNTKVLIEDNRARMLNYFLAQYPHLLPLIPKTIGQVRGTVEMKRSVKMTEERRQQMMGLIEHHVDHYSEFIPSIRLLEEFKVFGDEHSDDDLAIAFGWALVMLQADKTAVTQAVENTVANPVFRWKEGRIVRDLVNPNQPVRQMRIHPLLRKV